MVIATVISYCVVQITNAVASRREDIAKKNALSKMAEDKDGFLKFLKSQRHMVFKVTKDVVHVLSVNVLLPLL